MRFNRYNIFLFACVQGFLAGICPALAIYIIEVKADSELGPCSFGKLGEWSPFAQAFFIFFACASLGFILSYARLKLVTSRRIHEPKKPDKWYNIFWNKN